MDSIHQMDLTDIYLIFYPNTKEHNSYSAAHRSFSKIDHILRHKRNLYKFKIIENTTYILADHSAVKL